MLFASISRLKVRFATSLHVRVSLFHYRINLLSFVWWCYLFHPLGDELLNCCDLDACVERVVSILIVRIVMLCLNEVVAGLLTVLFITIINFSH
jgi:hypothetical protein